jgi:hypothetical protein
VRGGQPGRPAARTRPFADADVDDLLVDEEAGDGGIAMAFRA